MDDGQGWRPTIVLSLLAVLVIVAIGLPDPTEDRLGSVAQVIVALLGLVAVTVGALAVNRPEEWVAGTCVVTAIVLAVFVMFAGVPGSTLVALVFVGAITALGALLTGTTAAAHLLAAVPAAVVLALMGDQPGVVAGFAAGVAVLGAMTSRA